MKKLCFTTIFAVSLFIGIIRLQAQTIHPKLNQVELMKQFVGSWKFDVAKDTTAYYDFTSFGTGIEGNFRYIGKGNVFMEGKELWGYDKSADKFILSEVIKGQEIQLFAIWFISNTLCKAVSYSDLAVPEKAYFKADTELKSSDRFRQTITIENKLIKIISALNRLP